MAPLNAEIRRMLFARGFGGGCMGPVFGSHVVLLALNPVRSHQPITSDGGSVDMYYSINTMNQSCQAA